MNVFAASWTEQLRDHGYFLLRKVLSKAEIASILLELEHAFARDTGGSTLRSQSGEIYGARNLLKLWPDVERAWQYAPLLTVLTETLGHAFGLVRVLYFDKPPEQSWALPWHKDMTIAVRNNRLPSEQFQKPTFKAGVPHVEAPDWLLENMLTVRVHLDDMTERNGPLKVLPGSHQSGKALSSATRAPQSILGESGDVLLMRPLLSHCSNKSDPGTRERRRVLHYEFSGTDHLPDGYAWHDYR